MALLSAKYQYRQIWTLSHCTRSKTGMLHATTLNVVACNIPVLLQVKN